MESIRKKEYIAIQYKISLEIVDLWLIFISVE